MSGGSFNYAYSGVRSFCDELEIKIRQNGQSREDKNYPGECYPEYSPVTLVTLRQILAEAERVSKMMREAEWLYSGDHGEESFRSLVVPLLKL
jgi:hypothetical protein